MEKDKSKTEHLKKQKELEETTDITLYMRALINQRLIDKFLRVLKDTSVDCLSHSITPENCRICAPTDEPLFLESLDKDMKTASPCQPLKEKKIKAESVIVASTSDTPEVEEKEYMFTRAKGEIHIFEFDTGLDGYVEIYEDHPDYFLITKAIETRKKKIKKD